MFFVYCIIEILFSFYCFVLLVIPAGPGSDFETAESIGKQWHVLQVRLPEFFHIDTVHLLVHLIQHIHIRRICEYRDNAADRDEDTECQSHTGQPDPGNTHIVHALPSFPGEQCKENAQSTGGNGQQSRAA